VKHRPPAHDAWLLDSFLQSGHTPEESIAYLADFADFEDEQLRQRSSPAWMISPLAGGWRSRLRGLLGSSGEVTFAAGARPVLTSSSPPSGASPWTEKPQHPAQNAKEDQDDHGLG
jgi:hypothetical protein